MIDYIDEPNGKKTELLLRYISSRLSSREDCRKVPYEVIIDHMGVRMSPLVFVYPSRYKRKDTDKLDIISYVHQYKMNKALLSEFVFGKYQYQLSPDGKRRRWIKLK